MRVNNNIQDDTDSWHLWKMVGWRRLFSYVMPVERLTPASNVDTAMILDQ